MGGGIQEAKGGNFEAYSKEEKGGGGGGGWKGGRKEKGPREA